jgi:hypothetical protein
MTPQRLVQQTAHAQGIPLTLALPAFWAFTAAAVLAGLVAGLVSLVLRGPKRTRQMFLNIEKRAAMAQTDVRVRAEALRNPPNP